MAYKQDKGRNNTPASSPIDMHGPLQQKTKKVTVRGSDYKDGYKWVDDEDDPGYEKKVKVPGYGLSDHAKQHVHKVKQPNFFRSQEKTVLKMSKADFKSSISKPTNEPSKNWAKSNDYDDHKKNDGFKEVDSYEKGTHYTGAAPTAQEYKKSYRKENTKLAAMGIGSGIIWNLMNKAGK